MTTTKSVAKNRLVSEEGVLDSGLPMVPQLLLPPAAPDLLHSNDCAVAGSDCSPGRAGGIRNVSRQSRLYGDATRRLGAPDRGLLLQQTELIDSLLL